MDILVTEGYTDCALVEAILDKRLGFCLEQSVNRLPDLLRKLVGQYPAANGDMIRQDTPHFFCKEASWVAVKVAGGQSKIGKVIANILEASKLVSKEENIRFIIFTDTDDKTDKKIKSEINRLLSEQEIELNDQEIIFEGSAYECIIYKLPQKGSGAVEKILLQITEKIYPEITQCALEYRTNIMDKRFEALRRDKWAARTEIQEFYADKVEFGAIASVLKPDRPIGYAVKDELIHKENFDRLADIEEFKELCLFLEEKLDDDNSYVQKI